MYINVQAGTKDAFKEETKIKAIFPGDLQMYEIKNQCQQIFGPESEACDQNLVNYLIFYILSKYVYNKTECLLI